MVDRQYSDDRLVAQTRKWVETVIIGHNYCPFARREMERDSIRYHIVHDTEVNSLLAAVVDECVWLDKHAETETTLIIFPQGLQDFSRFLDVLDMAEQLLVSQGYEGIYQLASFHPQYCFQGAAEDDAANYTNRSPYPMFHLIRENSITAAVANHADAASIPERNIEFARQQGLEKMQSLLADAMQVEE